MKILFGKYYGKELSELDSAYLLWIIEHYENSDWRLINECKRELSSRLKLEWIQEDGVSEIKNKLSKLNSKLQHLELIISRTDLHKGNPYIIWQFMASPEYLKACINLLQ